jgi:hypothetical protein
MEAPIYFGSLGFAVKDNPLPHVDSQRAYISSEDFISEV